MIKNAPGIEETAERAYKLYGERHQLMKTAEECCELAAAINRYLIGEGNDTEVISEAADVGICLQYINISFGHAAIYLERCRKLDRLERRMNGSENE